VTESEIRDVPAYNRACGIMWIVFSLVFWTATIVGIWNETVAEHIIGGGCLLGFPALIITWIPLDSFFGLLESLKQKK